MGYRIRICMVVASLCSVVVLSLGLGACGDSQSPSPTGDSLVDAEDADSTNNRSILAYENFEFVIGATTPEEELLGETMARAIEAEGGAVERSFDFDDAQDMREALLSGDLDFYWVPLETAADDYVEVADSSVDDRSLLREINAADLDANGVEWNQVYAALDGDAYGLTYLNDPGNEMSGVAVFDDMADWAARSLETTDSVARVQNGETVDAVVDDYIATFGPFPR